MANTQIAARQLGDDFQAYYFWINAIKMLLPHSKIGSVSYECKEASPFDDVVVHYTTCIMNEGTKTQYNRDYIQCKFRVRSDMLLKWTDLIDPNCYNNKDSILKRGYNFYLRQKDNCYRLFLCTPVTFEPKDLLAHYITNLEGGIDVAGLYDSNDAKTRAMIDSIRTAIGCENDEHLKGFLSKLRFEQGKTIHNLKLELSYICNLANINYDVSRDSEFFTSLIRKENSRGNTIFDKEKIETICKDENLFIKERIKVGIIGIGKSDSRIETLKSLGDKCLDLSAMFIGRRINNEDGWEDVIRMSEKFVNEQLPYGHDYTICLSGTFSVAFLLGKLVGFKRGDIALENRSGLWVKPKRQAKILREEESEFPMACDFEVNDCENAVVCISVGDQSITKDVLKYMREVKLARYKLLNYYNDVADINSDDAWEFARSASCAIKSFIFETSSNYLHLFYRGPAEIMFMLGQYSNEWGECQIYDFDFEEAKFSDKKYFKGIKI